MKPTRVSEMTATESTIEKYRPRLFLKEILSSLWLISNSVTGGPDKPDVLCRTPLIKPADTEAIFSLLMKRVLPDSNRIPDIRITPDMTIVNRSIGTRDNIDIPKGIPVIAAPDMGKIAFKFNVRLFEIVIT